MSCLKQNIHTHSHTHALPRLKKMICSAAVYWAFESWSGDIRSVTLLRGRGGRERYGRRWKEELRKMGTWQLPSPCWRVTKAQTWIHTPTNVPVWKLWSGADMLLILLLLEHTLDRQQVNQITGYHTAAEHILDRASVCWRQSVCTHIVLIFPHHRYF